MAQTVELVAEQAEPQVHAAGVASRVQARTRLGLCWPQQMGNICGKAGVQGLPVGAQVPSSILEGIQKNSVLQKYRALYRSVFEDAVSEMANYPILDVSLLLLTTEPPTFHGVHTYPV